MTTFTLIFLFAYSIPNADLTGRTTIDNFPSAAACEAFAYGVAHGSPEFHVITYSCVEQEST